ncbi:SDR family NAD(P)-dependent oxidoreductase [bacterium]|jgi:UDP-N-acetylglucosamine/UDP-N-acetylgalactosamine 4-epimerase|nr:SDR family NAD(P)-dependent oxidoreductase [bacterium]
MIASEFYKNIIVLVTGGAGFIGSHIVEDLVDLGAKVRVIDNLSSGFSQNLEHIKNKIEFIVGDITDAKTVLQVTKDCKVIFHLAAFVSAPDSVNKPHECYSTNIEGTKNLLAAAAKNNVERFVFSSSSAVYGTKDQPCTESMPCQPESPYGFSKFMGELWCKEYSQTFGLKTVCLRYFNVHGSRQNPEGGYAAVVAKFKSLMAQNKPVTIFGDGKQTRDYIPVESVANANVTLAMMPKHLMAGDTYNIGTGKSIDLIELVGLLKKDFPKYTAQINFEPARQGDIKNSSADISKYNGALELLNK